MIYAIAALIIVLSFLQDSSHDKNACHIFWVPLAAICIVEKLIPAPGFYFVGVLCASFSATILLKYIKTKLSSSLVKALFISMGINLAGLGIWYYDFPQDSYYGSFILFYLWVVSIILKKGTINWLKHFNASLSRWESLQSRLACLSK